MRDDPRTHKLMEGFYILSKQYNLAVITEEKKESDKKIPFTCNKMGIHCVNLNDFAEENGIIF